MLLSADPHVNTAVVGEEGGLGAAGGGSQLHSDSDQERGVLAQ